ncbi:MAG: peptidoglycan DD-metalloendopeptidase family protein [Deltaproteobacteria bacterium]|nr:peptidoglycan DD-metalloendopeptidase family protein [Deltaproteobacteria bacterium]
MWRPEVQRAALAGLLLALLAPLPLRGDRASDLARRKEEVRSSLAELAAKEGDVLAAMDELESNLAIEEAALRAAERKAEVLEVDLKETRARRDHARERLAQRRAALEPRLVVRYQLGRLGTLPLLLSSTSLSEMRNRQTMLSRVLQADARVIEEVRVLERSLDEDTLRLEEGTVALEKLRASAAARVKRLRDARTEREATLAVLGEERTIRERMLTQLEAAQKRLGGMVRELGAASRGGGEAGFRALRGRLPLPTAGTIEAGFGVQREERYETKTLHKGVDLRAPKGTKVQAVAPGKVVHAGWLRGYGNLIIIDHGDAYFTLMAHLDRMFVAIGEELEAGKVVGLVGDTASLKGAYLYFEIRHRGEALDPRRWFQ